MTRDPNKYPYSIHAPHFINSITISDDLSVISKVKERQLLALRDRTLEETERWFLAMRDRLNAQSISFIWDHDLVTLHNMPPLATEEIDSGPLSLTHGQPFSRKRPLTDTLSSLEEVGAGLLGMDVTEPQSFIQRLEDRARQMGASKPKNQLTYRYQILYRIWDEKLLQNNSKRGGNSHRQKVLSPPFFDSPQWVAGQGKEGMLMCKMPLENLGLFLERNKDISFFIYRTYDVSEISAQNHRRITCSVETDDILDITISESVQPITDDFVQSVKALLESQEYYSDIHREFQTTSELQAPYLFVYHGRQDLDVVLGTLDSSAKEQMKLFLNYVTESCGDEYSAADALISQGKITSNYVKYLFGLATLSFGSLAVSI